MSTDATNPVGGEDTGTPTLEPDAEVETEGQDELIEGDPDDDSDPDSPEGEPDDDDEEEVDLDDDLKLKVPKSIAQKLREGHLRQADYTRKTQEVAELRRAADTYRQNIAQATQQELHWFQQAGALGQQLAAYQGRNFAAELAQANQAYDYDRAGQIQVEAEHARQLKDAHAQAVQAVGYFEQQRVSTTQQETARRVEEGRTQLAKEFTDWNEKKATYVDFAIAQGFTRDELADIEADPRQCRILRAAFENTQSQRKISNLAKLANDKKVQPAKVLKGTSGSSPVSAATKDFRAFEKLAAKAN